jgi:putative acetyltransferase
LTTIRLEKYGDAAAIRRVNELAFARSVEADIVDKLRANCAECLSLVADDGGVVGHILFTPAAIVGAGRRVAGMGLAPMAVLPERQRRGIGSMLARKGIDMLHESGCPFVIVLGHPEYYPRFGFEPASQRGIACQWEGVPDEAFMILMLDAGTMDGVSGVAKYREEFNEAV